MTEADLENFRLRFRLALLERLVVKTAFAANHAIGTLTVAAVRDGLTGWLDANSEEALRTYGAALGDPALVALFADEAKEITDTMKATSKK